MHCQLNQRNFVTIFFRYGLQNEPKAVAFLEQVLNHRKEHDSFVCESVGLVVSKDSPFLAASPDRICKCLCHEAKCVLEVKCPPTVNGKNIQEHASKTKGFCLVLNEETKELYLDPNHEYYFQVKTWMFTISYVFGYEISPFNIAVPIANVCDRATARYFCRVQR